MLLRRRMMTKTALPSDSFAWGYASVGDYVLDNYKIKSSISEEDKKHVIAIVAAPGLCMHVRELPKANWQEAKEFSSKMIVNGFTGFKLPSKNEMLQILPNMVSAMNNGVYDALNYMNCVGMMDGEYYWTETEYSSDNRAAEVVLPDNISMTAAYHKTSLARPWPCVRFDDLAKYNGSQSNINTLVDVKDVNPLDICFVDITNGFKLNYRSISAYDQLIKSYSPYKRFALGFIGRKYIPDYGYSHGYAFVLPLYTDTEMETLRCRNFCKSSVGLDELYTQLIQEDPYAQFELTYELVSGSNLAYVLEEYTKMLVPDDTTKYQYNAIMQYSFDNITGLSQTLLYDIPFIPELHDSLKDTTAFITDITNVFGEEYSTTYRSSTKWTMTLKSTKQAYAYWMKMAITAAGDGSSPALPILRIPYSL